MNHNPRRPPVQPWIPPQKPQKAAVRTVYVEREKPKGSAPVWWVMSLAIMQVLAVGVWVLSLRAMGSDELEKGQGMMGHLVGGGMIAGGIVLAAVNVTQLILVAVAIARGAVMSGIAAMILGSLLAVAAWGGAIFGTVWAIALR